MKRNKELREGKEKQRISRKEEIIESLLNQQKLMTDMILKILELEGNKEEIEKMKKKFNEMIKLYEEGLKRLEEMEERIKKENKKKKNNQ